MMRRNVKNVCASLRHFVGSDWVRESGHSGGLQWQRCSNQDAATSRACAVDRRLLSGRRRSGVERHGQSAEQVAGASGVAVAAMSETRKEAEVGKKGRIRLAVGEAEEGEFAAEPTFAVEYPGDARKLEILRKNPLVPIGAGLTAAILFSGLFAFNRGSQRWSQRMMRARVVAQGATLVVLMHSVYALRAEDGGGGSEGE